MPEFAVFENNDFVLFSSFLAPNFEGPTPGLFSTGFFYSNGFDGSPTVEVEGVDLLFDDDNNVISGRVTGIRWNTYEYTGMSSFPYFVNQNSGIFGLDLPATQVVQALEDSWTLTGPDRFAGVAAFFEGQELTLDYRFLSFDGIEAAVYDNLPEDQQVRILLNSEDNEVTTFAAGSVVYGAGGNDTLTGQNGWDVFHGGDGSDLIYGAGGNDGVFAGAGFDVVHGGDDDDRILGGTQADNLFGDAGADILWGDAGFDRLFGGPGDDLLYGGTEGDALFGQLGNDTLMGETGDDRLFGGAGFDMLNGGQGNDVLAGNFNADIFVFTDGFGMDTITDFAALNPFEKIDLSAVTQITDLEDLLLDHLTQSGMDALITVDADNVITLLNVDIGALDAPDFVF